MTVLQLQLKCSVCHGVVVDAQVMQSSLSGNNATNGAGISVQQVAFMSLYNVSITVRLMHYLSNGLLISMLLYFLYPKMSE